MFHSRDFDRFAQLIIVLHGRVFANNNLVGIGATGNGYGIQIGNYDTYNGFLEVNHQLDGYYDFDVIQISNDRIKLKDNYNNVTYYLEGYEKFSFDYDQIFYDNIEYFLQEYNAWEKTFTSNEGEINEFDYENFLAFTPENLTTFYSSQDQVGTNIANKFNADHHVISIENFLEYLPKAISITTKYSWFTTATELIADSPSLPTITLSTN